jgi:hypothetical protein
MYENNFTVNYIIKAIKITGELKWLAELAEKKLSIANNKL